MATVQSQSTSNPSSISQAATIAALEGPQDFLAPRALEFQARRDRALELVRAIPGLTCRTAEGAFYLYPNCSALIGRRRPVGAVIGSDDDFSLCLLDQARVAVVQGSAYGLAPHFRSSIATSMELIEKAIGRIADAVKALR
jgi:aspartate aminotransferase